MALSLRLQSVRRPTLLRSTYAYSSAADAFPNVPAVTPPSSPNRSEVAVKELPNGVRLVAMDSPSPVATVGVYAGAGARHERGSELGVSSLISRLVFEATQQRTGFMVVRELEHTGASVTATSNREQLSLRAQCLKEKVDEVLPQVVEMLTQPKLQHFVIKDKKGYQAGLNSAAASNFDTAVTEFMHAAAFGSTGLGNTVYTDNLNHIDSNGAVAFHNRQVTPDNLVIAGVGVTVETLEHAVKDAFHSVEGKKPAAQATTYSGGESRNAYSLPGAVFSVGFNGAAFGAKDHATIAVINSLLGGSDSVAHSRLSTVAGDGVDSVESFFHSHSDGGLFGVTLCAAESAAPSAAKGALDAIKGLASKAPSAEELQRAKKSVQSNMLMALESDNAACDDIAVQILTSNKYTAPSALAAAVEKVTAADVTRVMKAATASNPTVVSFGQAWAVPTQAEVRAHLA